MRKKKEKIFWGIFLLLAAVFLIVSQMGVLEGVGVVSVLFAIFWVAVLVDGVINRSFGKILFSIAFLCIIFDEPLGIEKITPWTVLAAALLGTIGLNMIFKKKKHRHYDSDWDMRKDKIIDVDATIDTEQGESVNGSKVVFSTSFGSAVKYVNSDNFEFASLECNFGAMKVYFDNAVIQNGNATIDLDISFAGVELYFPKHWTVVNHADCAFGGLDEKNHSNSTGSPVVTITGDINFSGVTIMYI